MLEMGMYASNKDMCLNQGYMLDIGMYASNGIYAICRYLVYMAYYYCWDSRTLLKTGHDQSLLYTFQAIAHNNNNNNNNSNSVALVCERTILTERPPLVGEVSANYC
jgi:hypothetical protein